MSGRGAKKRGRPPKSTSFEKNKKFQFHLLKKPKYLQNQSVASTPSASRASSPHGSDVSRLSSSRKTRGATSHKSKKRGGTSSAYTRRGYNPTAVEYHDSEYHYGSDFGDESEKSEQDEEHASESGSDGSAVDGAVSESDFSVSSLSTAGDTPKKSAGNITRNASPEPLWLQDERQIPPLQLPPSSEDLLIQHNLVLQVVGIYEVLRRFRHLVRLTPFRIEDLCAALSCEEQSTLLAEIHVMLLKALLREEDAQQTHFGPLDHKDSVNITLFLLDSMTWPEILRIYVESDKSFDKEVHKILNSCEYPFTAVENRVLVLQFLCNQFLTTNPVRDDLLSEVPIHYDDHCRVCHRLGDLLCCETCPAVYHLECVDPPLVDVPSEDWQCALCKIHKTPGVTDCLMDAEKQGILSRHEHLGFDRHGRKYWFISRRLFIESEDGEVWYYTTTEQFKELLERLDSEEMEFPLVRELQELKQEITRQMEITEKLTNQAKGSRKSYLENENANILKQRKLRIEENLGMKFDGGSNDDNVDVNNVHDNEQAEDSVASEDNDQDKCELNKNKSKLKKFDEVPERLTRLKTTQLSSGLFKLGAENTFKAYVNQYASNPLALNKPQRNEERDKKRYMAHKFSLSSNQEFKWVGLQYATKNVIVNTIRQTILQMESNIVVQFMHPNWLLLKKPWVQAVQQSNGARDFSRALCVIQACIKSVVWVPAWHEQLGHVKLMRTTALDREERKKLDKREKKEKEEEEERYRTSCNFVKYSLGMKHQIWKQKGEEYRIHGQYGWLWMSATRKYKKCNSTSKPSLADGPAKFTIRVKEENVMKVLAVEPKTYEYLMTNRSNQEIMEKLPPSMRNLDIQKENENFDEIDIEKALASPTRRYYPKIARKSKLDDLLTRRNYLKVLEEKKLSASGVPVKKEEKVDVKTEDEKIDVEKVDNDTCAIPNHNNSRVQHNPVLESLRTQYLKLHLITKHSKCYSRACNQMNSAINPTKVTSPCYSPLCLKKRALLQKMLTALKENSETLSPRKNASILEQYLKGKNNSDVKENENILGDLLSAVAFAKECDIKADGVKPVKKEETIETEIKTENTLEDIDVPAVGNEMDIDITCNSNDENDMEIGPLKELTDLDDDRPPIPKLRITRGRSAKLSSASQEGVVNSNALPPKNKTDAYKCSVSDIKIDDKPKYRATINRRFGMPRIKRDDKQVKKETDGETVRVYSAEKPRGKVYLKKIQSDPTSSMDKRKKKTPVKYPPCSIFHTRSKAKTIMVLAQHELRKLSRTAGVTNCPGFSASAKANQAVWPYPCPRPLFKTCWLYKTVNLQWLATAALQFRIMWACLRWDDMVAKAATADGKHQLTTDTEIVSLELLKHRHLGQFSERTEYLRRRVVIPLELPKTVREVTSIRSGLRKRKRAESPQNTEPQVSEEWVEEERLELWEVRVYGERGERSERTAPLTRTASGRLPVRAVPLAPAASSPTTPTTPDLKDRLEQQLRDQRSAHQHRQLEKNKSTPNSGKSALTSLLSGETSTPTAQKTVIGTRRIIMTKSADGTTRVIAQPLPKAETPKPATPAQKDGPQKVQIIRGPDGKLAVRGLLPGQQLIQMPDGKLHVVSAGQHNAVGQLIASANTPDKTKEEGESSTSQGKVRAIGGEVRVGARPPAVVVRSRAPSLAPAPASAPASAPAPLVARPQRLAAPQQIVVNNPMLVQQIAAGKIQLATVNGQQVLIRPTGNNQAQIVAHIGQSPAPRPAPAPPALVPALVPVPAAPAPAPSPSPAPANPSAPNTPLTEDQIMERRLLAGQPPGTVIKTVTAQVMQTTSGPKIVLQGLHGYSLTPQQLALVQHQVKQQLLKTQECTGKQGMLGPTKMYLAVQPAPAPAQSTLVPMAPVATLPANAQNVVEDSPSKPKEIIVNGDDKKVLTLLNKPGKIGENHVDGSERSAGQGDKFVLTPDYIQQTIKSALKQENLNPEIEEKLLQLQRYQEKRMKPDGSGVVVERAGSPERERVRPRSRSASRSRSPSASPPRRRPAAPRRDDDHEWVEVSPRKRARAAPAHPSPAAAAAAAAAATATPLTPLTPLTPPAPPTHNTHARHSNSRLQMLLFKHKELLKKEIIKKRGLLEKELGVEIQKELSAELALRTRAERSKQEEVRGSGAGGGGGGGGTLGGGGGGGKRRAAAAATTPVASRRHQAPKKSSKKEKILCICRTPYDNTKFYVGCEHCSNWFHGSCVGITEEMSKSMQEYVCAECRRAAETQELYCLCRQPYDNTQFYICCDRCQDWFHGRCVGILQSEADNIDEYICPNCQKNNSVNFANMKELTMKDFENLRRLMKQITSHRNAWPFMDPVDPREAPTYYKIIKEPMDLHTVERKVNEQVYSTLSEFIGDMTKIFDNCRYFNPKDSEFYRCAENLEAFFAHKIKNFREKLFETNQ